MSDSIKAASVEGKKSKRNKRRCAAKIINNILDRSEFSDLEVNWQNVSIPWTQNPISLDIRYHFETEDQEGNIFSGFIFVRSEEEKMKVQVIEKENPRTGAIEKVEVITEGETKLTCHLRDYKSFIVQNTLAPIDYKAKRKGTSFFALKNINGTTVLRLKNISDSMDKADKDELVFERIGEDINKNDGIEVDFGHYSDFTNEKFLEFKRELAKYERKLKDLGVTKIRVANSNTFYDYSGGTLIILDGSMRYRDRYTNPVNKALDGLKEMIQELENQ